MHFLYPSWVPPSIAQKDPTGTPACVRYFDCNAQEMTKSPRLFACMSSLIGSNLRPLVGNIQAAARELSYLKQRPNESDEEWREKCRNAESSLQSLVLLLDYLLDDLSSLQGWGSRTLQYDHQMQEQVLSVIEDSEQEALDGAQGQPVVEPEEEARAAHIATRFDSALEQLEALQAIIVSGAAIHP